MDWPTEDEDHGPRGVAVTALGFALMILTAVVVCLLGAYIIGAHIWAMVTISSTQTDQWHQNPRALSLTRRFRQDSQRPLASTKSGPEARSVRTRPATAATR